MTKERKLAIKMWKKIVAKCKSGSKFNVYTFKSKFCKKHHLDWVNECYFCTYCVTCYRCPLNSCKSIYKRVCSEHDVASAKLILKTLRGGTNDLRRNRV